MVVHVTGLFRIIVNTTMFEICLGVDFSTLTNGNLSMIVQLTWFHFEIGMQHLGLVSELKKIKAIIELCVSIPV